MLQGRSINRINRIGGIVAGQPAHYEIWTQGGIIEVKNNNDVEAIDNAVYEAKKMDVNVNDYVRYVIEEENILNIRKRQKWDD